MRYQESETLKSFLTGPGMAGGLQLAQGGPWGVEGTWMGGRGSEEERQGRLPDTVDTPLDWGCGRGELPVTGQRPPTPRGQSSCGSLGVLPPRLFYVTCYPPWLPSTCEWEV